MKAMLLFMVRYSPARIAVTIAVAVVAGIANTALLPLIHRALSQIGDNLGLVWPFVALVLILPVLRTLSAYLIVALIQQSVHEMRLRLSKQILTAPLRRLEQMGPGEILAVIMGDVITVAQGLAVLPTFCMIATVAIGCLSYLTWLFWPAGVAVMITTVVGLLIFEILVHRGRGYFNLVREERDVLFGHFRALTDGTKELKMHGARRDYFLDAQLSPTSDSLRRNNLRGMLWFGGADSVGQILFFCAIGVLLFLLPSLVSGMTPDVVTGYTLLLLYMIVPLQSLTSSMAPLNNASVSYDKVKSLGMSFDRVDSEQQMGVAAEPTWSRITYEGLVHAYHREKEDQVFSMGPIDLELRPGELTLLIGGNGSGKTTLAKLLVGLYKPEQGRILWDGAPVDEANLDAFRQLFTCVFSDFYLFEDLMWLETDAVDESARAYLNRLQLDHKVKVVDGKLSTVDLSQGQRKRLALLTAYLENRPIYLFDEWASDQDPLFKDVFYRVLLPELKKRGKTVIAISHDDHYFDCADRIIKLDYGQIEYDQPVTETVHASR